MSKENLFEIGIKQRFWQSSIVCWTWISALWAAEMQSSIVRRQSNKGRCFKVPSQILIFIWYREEIGLVSRRLMDMITVTATIEMFCIFISLLYFLRLQVFFSWYFHSKQSNKTSKYKLLYRIKIMRKFKLEKNN